MKNPRNACCGDFSYTTMMKGHSTMIAENLERYLLAVPKAGLHVHLEGSIQPATLLILAQRNGVDLPVHSVAEMQNWFKYRDFNHFIEIYLDISRCLKTAGDYELIAYEFGASMAQQHA